MKALRRHVIMFASYYEHAVLGLSITALVLDIASALLHRSVLGETAERAVNLFALLAATVSVALEWSRGGVAREATLSLVLIAIALAVRTMS